MAGYLKAFWTLCGRRTYGMGPNPISYLDIVLYGDRHMFDDFEEFESIMCKMDERWMAIMSKRKS